MQSMQTPSIECEKKHGVHIIPTATDKNSFTFAQMVAWSTASFCFKIKGKLVNFKNL